MACPTMGRVAKTLWLILFVNLAVAVTKIIIGSAISSTSLVADGYHSLTDGISNVIGLVGVYLASKPEDAAHPYGHGKYEYLTGLFIGGMLFVIVAKVVTQAITRLLDPVTPQISGESLMGLLATIVVNIAVSTYEYRQGKALGSYILQADALHTRSDVYISIGVLGSLFGIKLGAPVILDPLVSLLVAGFILVAGIKIIRDTSNILVDRAAIETSIIADIALAFPEVKGVHDIRSRGSKEAIYVDMHILIEPSMSVAAAHDLVHAIEDAIRERFSDRVSVLIHTEPYGTGDSRNNSD